MAAIDRLNGLASETTLAIKAPVAVATTANITLSGVQAIDGVTVGNNSERVLVKNQTDQTTNGIYIASSGNWTLAQDAGGNTDWTAGTLVRVQGGSVNSGLIFVQTGTDDPIVIGTSALVFIPSSSGSGGGLQRSVTTTPIVVGLTDQVLNCNIPTSAACALPLASSRKGLPVTFKDKGQALTHNITITASGSDLIDGQTTFTLTNNYQSVTLVPANDGVNTGWSIE